MSKELSELQHRSVEQITEQFKCSIELSRNAHKKFSWDIKVRGNIDDECISRLKRINNALIADFGEVSE